MDGKPAGTATFTPATAADGSVTVSAAFDVTVKTLLGRYRYTLRSTERWADGKLVALDATADDDGTKHAVRAAAGADGLAVTADGKRATAPAAAIASTGWVRPAVGPAVLLDAEDGSRTPVTVTDAGPVRVTVGGAAIDGRKLRLAGDGVDSEWWFDAAGRPIGQRLKWDGHTVVLALQPAGR